ncbi:MAG: hypothetical protein AVDCRST_MAG93-7079, partial [uncultured Chloroflexia bacterium]
SPRFDLCSCVVRFPNSPTCLQQTAPDLAREFLFVDRVGCRSLIFGWTPTSIPLSHPHITALFASNDESAIGAIHAAQKLGRRLPEDLSIVGFDSAFPDAAIVTTVIRSRLVERQSVCVLAPTTRSGGV